MVQISNSMMYPTFLMLYLAVLCAIMEDTYADFEHRCSDDDYMIQRPGSNRITACGNRLTNLVLKMCNGRPVVRKKRGIQYKSPKGFLHDIEKSEQEANNFLNFDKRQQNDFGIVCECCVHRCTHSELMQYCAGKDKRKRRSTKSTSHNLFPITDEVLNDFYNELDRLNYTSVMQQDMMSISELERQPFIRTIEKQKVANIERGVNTKRAEDSSFLFSSSDEAGNYNNNDLKNYLHELIKSIHLSQPEKTTSDDLSYDIESLKSTIVQKLLKYFYEQIDAEQSEEPLY